jgi:hypothetical protein
MKEKFSEVFKSGGHKNSLGRSDEVLNEVLKNKKKILELYQCISDQDAWVRMRAIDTFEKVIRENPDWVEPFVEDIFNNLIHTSQPSIQWHIAQIFKQIKLSDKEKRQAVNWLSNLISSQSVDWIVAANAMSTLKHFLGEGFIKKENFRLLLRTQLKHKSKSVNKKAQKYLDEMTN